MKVLLWMPVFNQVEELPALLQRVAETPAAWDHFLIVNNGSDDGSAELLHATDYTVIDIPKNRGVGYAYMRAITWGKEQGFDVLVGIAGNGKMHPQEVERLLAPILSEGMDYVTGSRFLPGGGYPNLPRFRRLAIPIVNVLVGKLVGHELTDATCGFRAYKLELFDRASFDWRHPSLETYQFEYYLFAKVILSRNLRWCEVPVTMHYPPRGHRYTKIRPIWDWFAMLIPWIKARFDRKGFVEAS